MKIICVGRNYVDHIEELNNSLPENPVIFFKPSICLSNNSNFVLPGFSKNIHHEIELIFKISKNGRNIKENEAIKYISHVGLGIDFTARDIQDLNKKSGLPWGFSKSFNQSAIISPLKKIDYYDDLYNINFSLSKNNIITQTGNSKLMIFKIFFLISYISQFISLEKGDIIFSGTPKGVSKVNKGDKLIGYIENEKFIDLNII